MCTSEPGRFRVYSPALKPELVRTLYHLGKATGCPMTRLVDALLRHALGQLTLPESVLPHYQTLTQTPSRKIPA